MVLGILVWQEGGDYVVLLIATGALALWALARWLVRRHRDGKVTVLDPELFQLPHFKAGITGQMLQNITLGGAMIALPIFLQIKLEYDALETGLSLAPLSLTMFAVAILAGRKTGRRRPAKIIRTGFALTTLHHDELGRAENEQRQPLRIGGRPYLAEVISAVARRWRRDLEPRPWHRPQRRSRPIRPQRGSSLANAEQRATRPQTTPLST